MRPWRKRGRPAGRSLADALIFLALVVLVLLGAVGTGWISPQRDKGRFLDVDGDSLRKGEAEYRLHGIDAPELHQTCTAFNGGDFPCGQHSHEMLRSLIAGQALDCAVHEKDRYGRFVVTCRAGSRDINAEMVRSGWAIAYRRHGTAYAAAEAEARAARRGIWQGRFEIPEKWRAARRRQMVQGAIAGEPPPDD